MAMEKRPPPSCGGQAEGGRYNGKIKTQKESRFLSRFAGSE